MTKEQEYLQDLLNREYQRLLSLAIKNADDAQHVKNMRTVKKIAREQGLSIKHGE